MIPKPGKALVDLAMKLSTGVLPEIGSPYAAANAGMTAMLLIMLSQDSERAIANRMADISELKTLFAGAAVFPHQDGIASFADAEPDSLLLADVDRLHARGMSLLIDLHAWAESHDEGLDQEIWKFLARHADRNRFDI
ncbi:MAG: hypothetical protein GWM88_18405 [Pseudomonadales bacterium]|nr:hypothetical protein [Pseudomonadales bacterium]NIX09896.1 hypothetical protein [Pseudomonadales bacterium]